MTVTQATTATTTSVASSATSVTLFAASSNDRMRTIFNESTAVLYVKFGATASTTSYKFQLAPGALFEFTSPMYAGQVDGIWASANGFARLTSW
jgi:hypothetical protein